MSVCWRIPWKLVAILWGRRLKSPQKHFSFLFFQANPQPNFMELQHGKMLFRSFFQIRYGYTPSYMFTFLSPCVYWLLCPVGKAGLVSCLEFTFSISLMVVVAWKSIVLCAEPTKICSRHCGMFHFGGVLQQKRRLWYIGSWQSQIYAIWGVKCPVWMMGVGRVGVCNWPQRKEEHLKFATPT